jgi:hypothetical protein
MKALAILALLVVAAAADPMRDDREVVDPQRHSCPKAIAFTEITQCLSKNPDKVHLERVGTIAGARVVRLDVPDRPAFDKLLLYLEEGGVWKVAGDWLLRDVSVIDLQPVTIGKHAGVRIDIGEAYETPVNLVDPDDGSTSARPALVRTSTAVFCGGAALGCYRIMTGCEVLIRGNARWMFHGHVKVEGNQVTVEGDRRHGGRWCMAQPENTFLHWPR